MESLEDAAPQTRLQQRRSMNQVDLDQAGCLWSLFMHMRQRRQDKQVLQKRYKTVYIVDLWTATGIRMQQCNQISPTWSNLWPCIEV